MSQVLATVQALVCPKCNSEDVVTRYHRARHLCDPWSRFTNNSQDGEHLHYTCRNCQWDWTGACADVS